MSDGHELLPAVYDSTFVRPGDTLILFGRSVLSDSEIEDMRQQAAEQMPTVKIAYFVGVEKALIYRPDAEDAA